MCSLYASPWKKIQCKQLLHHFGNLGKFVRQHNRIVTTCGLRVKLKCYVHHFTYLLTPWSRILLEKLAGFQLVKKFPTFYETRTFITALTIARHLLQSLSSSIQSTPSHPTSCRCILLSSHLRLGLQSRSFPSGFPIKNLYKPRLSPIHAICPTHLILLDLIVRTISGEEYRSLSSSLCSFLHSPFPSSLLDPNFLLNTLSSSTQRTFLPQCERPNFTLIHNKNSHHLI